MDHTLLLESRRQLSSIASITGAGYYYAIGSSGKRFMCYVFTVTSHKGAWKIYRRYREFNAVQKRLGSKVPLPRKGSMFFRSTRNHRKRVERRYQGLCAWLTTVFALLKGPTNSSPAGDSLSRAAVLRIASDCTHLYDFLTTQSPAPRRAEELNDSADGDDGADDATAEFVAKVTDIEQQLLAARAEIMTMSTAMAAWTAGPVRALSRIADMQRRVTAMAVPDGVRSPSNELHAVDPETAAVVHALEGVYASLEPQVSARQAAMVAPIDRLCTGSLPKLKELVTLWAEHAGTYNTAARHWGSGKGAPPPWLQAQMLESRDVMRRSQRKAMRRLARLQEQAQAALRSAAVVLARWDLSVMRAVMPAMTTFGDGVSTPGARPSPVPPKIHGGAGHGAGAGAGAGASATHARSGHSGAGTGGGEGSASGGPLGPGGGVGPPSPVARAADAAIQRASGPADAPQLAAAPQPRHHRHQQLQQLSQRSSMRHTPMPRAAAALMSLFDEPSEPPARAPAPAPAARKRGGSDDDDDGGISRLDSQRSQKFNSRTVGPGDLKQALEAFESPREFRRTRSHGNDDDGGSSPVAGGGGARGGGLWAMLGLGDDESSQPSPLSTGPASRRVADLSDDDGTLSDASSDPDAHDYDDSEGDDDEPNAAVSSSAAGADTSLASSATSSPPAGRTMAALRHITSPWKRPLQAQKGCANTRLRLKFGAAASQGTRASMEDATTCLPHAMGDQFAMFAVFDGHNGGECARYLEANLASAVFAAEPTELQLRDALHTAFMAVDGKILDGGISDGSGACAVVMVVAPTRLLIAHCGDSEALLSRKGATSRLCRRHRPTDELERRRIEAAGGIIKSGRVFGMLGVSRAFGDIDLKTSRGSFTSKFAGDIVTAQPDILELARSQAAVHEEFVVLACDGLFEVMTPAAVVSFVRDALHRHGDVQRATEELVTEAVQVRRTTDNVSAIVVVLNQHA